MTSEERKKEQDRFIKEYDARPYIRLQLRQMLILGALIGALAVHFWHLTFVTIMIWWSALSLIASITYAYSKRREDAKLRN